MRSFLNHLKEAKVKEIPWESDPKIGWWEDQDPITLYHGTHISKKSSILENGLDKKDSSTGMISLALEPNTGFGYASMYGGEADFRKAGSKAKISPEEERIVFVFEIPQEWIKKNLDPRLGGNMGRRKYLKDRSLYQKHKGKDFQYYQLLELRVSNEVPSNFIKGYMFKK